MSTSHKTAVIIGSGFGGSMAGLCLADEFKKRGRGETILMLERGTWWTTPVSTVQDKEVATYDFLVRKQQPVQHWSSQNHFRGAVDLLTRCYRRPGNEDGLYDFTTLGKPGFLGVFGRDSDGVSILRASGVGGGSLVYSNVTICPPDSVLEDPRWPLTWTAGERNSYWAADRIIADHRARRPFGSGRTPVSARCHGRATGSSPCGMDTTAQRCGLSHSMGLPQALCIPSRAASARGTAIRVEAQTGWAGALAMPVLGSADPQHESALTQCAHAASDAGHFDAAARVAEFPPARVASRIKIKSCKQEASLKSGPCEGVSK